MGDNTNNSTKTTALSRHEKRQAQKKKMTFGIIVFFEVCILIGIVAVFFHFYGKIRKGDFLEEKKKVTAEAGSTAKNTDAGRMSIDDDNFSLTCHKVQLVRDVDGNPVALIYFTFVNRMATPLSMSDVLPPSVKQGDYDCETFAVLDGAPDELYNRDLQISDGQSVECCYAVKLHDTMDTLLITIHDNYETFSDIDTFEIPISNATSAGENN